ncbi:MAG: hypothetical protein JNL97_07550 [Verrucomicrobiales bacterium]|nr:hypothetical protein [Verrucomicrobiales bacterium]
MKTLIALSLVLVGGLLCASPTFSNQRQLQRVAAFYESQGGGSRLPDELRPQPHTGFDWASLVAGTLLALSSVFVARLHGPPAPVSP